MTSTVAELAGASEDAVADERAVLAVTNLPGFGISAETDNAMEHRLCSKCGKLEVRMRV
jgi:hypothetical protein